MSRQDCAPAVSKPLAGAICLLLALATLLVYARIFRNGFIYLDDDRYLYDNPIIKAGLSASSLAWAFTTFYFGNWHPLTWISFLLDYQLWGVNAGAEHAVSLVLHIGSAVLLFLALTRMTRQPLRCAMVAGIFALHPLRVESVAWVAERKDVLSTFFLMLTLLLYARYVEAPTPKRYGRMATAFGLSLLAKSMAVTLPFVLLLLDFWPFRRFDFSQPGRPKLRRLLWEKAPLFGMSAIAAVLTSMAQPGAVASASQATFGARLANAVAAYFAYVEKAFWPVNLAVFYPFVEPTPLAVFSSLLILTAITIVAVREFRRRPYILTGWLWYAGMLVPVIGLVPVGQPVAMADRFTYVPLVGLSIALIWTVSDLIEKTAVPRWFAGALATLVLIAISMMTWHQLDYWKDSNTLFEHTLAVTRNNSFIEGNLGVVLQREGKLDEAVVLYRRVLAARPDDTAAKTNLGAALAIKGNHGEAIALYRQALAESPGYADAHANLGHELILTGQLDEASPQLSAALRLKPDSAAIKADMGLLFAARGSYSEARRYLEESLRLDASNASGQSNLCFVLQHLGRPDAAIASCEAALGIRPDMPDARFNLGNALAATGQTAAAAVEFSRVLAAVPNHAGARTALANLQQKPSH